MVEGRLPTGRIGVWLKRHVLLVCAFLVLGVSFFTYFRDYWYPNQLFWDESYHVAAAYKYVGDTFFMSDHPPLAKLFIALGEEIFHPNRNLDTSYFLRTDSLKEIPEGFSFVGLRFFPVMFATFSALLFFFILYKVSRRPRLSAIFSSLYLFDNALIVHSRGAMLDGTQIFFMLCTLLFFVTLLGRPKIRYLDYAILGTLAGATAASKVTGVLMLVMFLPLFFYKEPVVNTKKYMVEYLRRGLIFVGSAFIVFAGVYYIHALFTQNVVGGNYYKASPQLQKIAGQKQTANPVHFPLLFWNNIEFIKSWEGGVGKYNPNDPNENGSRFYSWPFSDKAIDYRWESDGTHARYLYLIGNPVIWLAGIAGVVSSVGVLGWAAIKRHSKNSRQLVVIGSLLGLYLIYMCLMAVIGHYRVIYLYLYLIPLILSLLMFFSSYVYIFDKAIKRKSRLLVIATGVLVAAIIGAYWFFSPLTYYQPLTQQQFKMRNWLPFWHLQDVL